MRGRRARAGSRRVCPFTTSRGMMIPVVKTTSRSIVFSSSRTFPGQSYSWEN